MSSLLEAAKKALPGVTNWKPLTNARMDSISGRAGSANLEMNAFGKQDGEGGVYSRAAVYARIDGIGAEPVDTPDEAAAWLRAQVTARRDALNAALGEGWVPVGERLPAPHVPVLAWAHTRVSYCCWHGDLWISYGSGVPVSVTHWLPLPAPPKTP